MFGGESEGEGKGMEGGDLLLVSNTPKDTGNISVSDKRPHLSC